MPIKVYKVADIIDGEAVFSGKRFRESDLAAVLTNLCPRDLLPASAWKCAIVSRTIIAHTKDGTPHTRARILIRPPTTRLDDVDAGMLSLIPDSSRRGI
jgi:hypothetical protein